MRGSGVALALMNGAGIRPTSSGLGQLVALNPMQAHQRRTARRSRQMLSSGNMTQALGAAQRKPLAGVHRTSLGCLWAD